MRPGMVARMGVGAAGGGGGGAFDPLSLSPLVALRPEGLAALADNDPIATWDNEGSLADATQGTSGSRPLCRTAIANGLRVARFDGTDDYLTLPSLAAIGSTDACSIFVVVKIAADPPASAGQTGLWDIDAAAAATHFPYTDGVVYDGSGSSERKTIGDPTPSLASAFRSYDVVSLLGSWTCFLDGTQLFTTTSSIPGCSATPTIGRSDASYHLNGDIPELLVYGTALSTPNRQSVEGYLRTKYALA